jgi:hypothetical protein
MSVFQIKTDVPIELWDQPTIEAERLRLDCETLAERFEEELEDWFIHRRDVERNLVVSFGKSTVDRSIRFD